MSRVLATWTLSAGWVLIAASVMVTLGRTSLLTWSVLALSGIVLPMVFFILATEGPVPTVAKILHDAEQRP